MTDDAGRDPHRTATPRLIVPLRASERDVGRAIDALLAGGKYTPDDLLGTAVVSRRDVFYAPAWAFEGRYEATWSALFGQDRSEHYTDSETRTDNGETRTESVTRTRTVTDWTPAQRGLRLPAGHRDERTTAFCGHPGGAGRTRLAA